MSPDPEVRLRCRQIVRRLSEGDLQARVDSFLAGRSDDFEGWRVVSLLMGDTPAAREVFVELMTLHPNVPKSLDGTPRDRAVAIDKAMTQIQELMFVKKQFPSRADAFALLLPAVDTAVPINATFDSLVLDVLRKEAASKIRRDAQLADPFRSLISRWMIRSSPSSRDDLLLLGLDWDLKATLSLAIQTLSDTKQTETLGMALQVIAKFGDRDHVQMLRPLMHDRRIASAKKLRP